MKHDFIAGDIFVVKDLCGVWGLGQHGQYAGDAEIGTVIMFIENEIKTLFFTICFLDGKCRTVAVRDLKDKCELVCR